MYIIKYDHLNYYKTQLSSRKHKNTCTVYKPYAENNVWLDERVNLRALSGTFKRSRPISDG